MKIYCDNQSTITLSKDASFHTRSKHIDIKYHYVCEQVKTSNIHLHYLPTGQMTTNTLMKALACPKYEHFVEQMGLQGTMP